MFENLVRESAFKFKGCISYGDALNLDHQRYKKSKKFLEAYKIVILPRNTL